MPDWQEAEDSQLLGQAQKGEVDAFGKLYQRHASRIFRFLAAHLDAPQDAEDLTADVFFRAWRALPSYHDRGVPFPAFLLRIARNALVDHYRRSAVLNSQPLDDVAESHPEARTEPAEIILTRMEHQHLRHVLDQLRPDYRTVLVLRFLSELSPEETSLVMRRSVGAVRVLQYRALAALRGLLASED
jgi:RNA polymerase sigma-70 factor, ECF subfamily